METIISRRTLLTAAALAVVSLPAWRGLLVPASAQEAAKETYVALGDSISTGYGLDEEAGEASFATLLAKECGYTLEVLAKDGQTAADLAEQLQDPEVVQSIAGASLVSVTAGGNDFMQALYTYLANAYNEAGAADAMTADDMAQALRLGDSAILAFAIKAVDGFATSQEAFGALTQFNTCLPKVLDAVKAASPEAKVVVATQYNPYAHLGPAAASLGLGGLSTAFEDCLGVLNQAIVAGCKKYDCLVADVYTKFQKAEKNPCNAAVSLKGTNLDFHPNAYGHALIAEVLLAAVTGVDPDEPEADESAADEPKVAAAGTNTSGSGAVSGGAKSV